MNRLSGVNIIGMILEFLGMSLAWHWYDWKLAVVIVIIIWGNNLEQRK